MEARRGSPALPAERLGLPLIPIAATLAASRLLLPVADAPARASLTALVYALAGLLALLLACPRTRGTAADTGWSLTVALLVWLAALSDPAARPALHALPALALTVFLLAATLLVLRRHIPSPLLLASFMLATFMPLFAAPLVEAAGNPEPLTAAVVGASPLSILAASLELDYLRTGWFYAHGGLGSLRYEYPSWPAACLLLALFPAAAVIRGLLPRIFSQHTADEAQ